MPLLLQGPPQSTDNTGLNTWRLFGELVDLDIKGVSSARYLGLLGKTLRGLLALGSQFELSLLQLIVPLLKLL